MSVSNAKGRSLAGRHATSHFKSHKVTSILFALIVPFFLYGLMKALPGGYAGLVAWGGTPMGALTLLAFLTVGMFHSRMSMNEVIVDYSSSAFLPKLNTFAMLGFWALGVAAILKIWLGA